MGGRRESDQEPAISEGTPPWVITFADLFTLLLIFFILLFSYARSDLARFKSLNASIKESFGAVSGEGRPTASAKPAGAQKPADRVDAGEAKIEALIAEIKNPLEAGGAAKGVLVRMDSDSLFEPGQAGLSPRADKSLEMITNILRKHGHNLIVAAHTSREPAKWASSNWELASMRGSAIVRALIAKGVAPERLSTASYADTRPMAEVTLPGSDKKNDRVEFIFEPVRRP